jgi:hypothetical protein
LNTTNGDIFDYEETNSKNKGKRYQVNKYNSGRRKNKNTGHTGPSVLAGDFYLNTSNGDIFDYDGSTWTGPSVNCSGNKW